MRSKWKGKFINLAVYKSKNLISKKIIDPKYLTKRIYYYIWNRNSIIPMFFNKKRIAVYNGKTFKSFIIKNKMLNNFKFGEFAITKSLGKKIHTVKKKKKKEKPKELNTFAELFAALDKKIEEQKKKKELLDLIEQKKIKEQTAALNNSTKQKSDT